MIIMTRDIKCYSRICLEANHYISTILLLLATLLTLTRSVRNLTANAVTTKVSFTQEVNFKNLFKSNEFFEIRGRYYIRNSYHS